MKTCDINLFCYKYEDCLTKTNGFCCIHWNKQPEVLDFEKESIPPCDACSGKLQIPKILRAPETKSCQFCGIFQPATNKYCTNCGRIP